MSIEYEFDIPWGMFRAATEAAIPVALARAAEHVRGVAVERTPHASGHLAGSAGVTVIGSGAASEALIKYEGPYARFQEKGMRADGTHIIRRRPAGGMTGFLETAMVTERDAALRIIADTISALA